MAYVKKGPFQNNVAAPPLNAAFFDGLETALVLAAAPVVAPAPSGDATGVTDTAALQPLITAAQNGGGTVRLQAGTYYTTGLTTASGYFQPRIVGQGRQYTFVKAVGTATPFTIVGISGAIVGGEISELAVVGPVASQTAPTNVGIELIGVCGMKIDVEFRYLAVGLRFHNRDSGMFTEFCVATNCAWTIVGTAIHYKVTSGNESFHGSGIDGGIINPPIGTTGPIVQIDSGCFPYNAPLSPTVFPNTPNTNIIVSNSTQHGGSSFQGNLKIECQNASGTNVVSTGSTSNSYLAGHVTALGGIVRFGRLYLANKIYYENTSLILSLKPWQRYTTLGGATTTITNPSDPFAGNGSYLISVVVQNGTASYYYRATLLVFINAAGGTSPVTTVAGSTISDTGAIGAPTFAWSSGLTVTNASFGTAYAATISVTSLGGDFGGDNLGQY